MLVLLIIFMVSAPMMNTGVEVDLPAAQAPQVEINEEKLLLTVGKDQKVYLGRDEVPYEQVRGDLAGQRPHAEGKGSSTCRPTRPFRTASSSK